MNIIWGMASTDFGCKTQFDQFGLQIFSTHAKLNLGVMSPPTRLRTKLDPKQKVNQH